VITTHVLDTARGGPAAGVAVLLEMRTGGNWVAIARGRTDDRGRLTSLTDDVAVSTGTYRLTFDVSAYQRDNGAASFFPEVQVVFDVAHGTEHYHVPLLLSPFGYSTYRGT